MDTTQRRSITLDRWLNPQLMTTDIRGSSKKQTGQQNNIQILTRSLDVSFSRSQVSAETPATSAPLLEPSVPNIARRESSSWVVRLPTPSSVLSASTRSAPVEVTASSVPCVWMLETSPGVPRPSPARPVSLPLSTTPPTTSWSVPVPWSRTPSSRSMPPPSASGTRLTTPPPLVLARARVLSRPSPRSSPRPARTTSSARLSPARLMPRSTPPLTTSSLLAVSTPACLRALVSLAALTDTSLRARSWLSTSASLRSKLAVRSFYK